ncbi:hypothetical protein Acor_51530 [Acrocarpospora corrugata]|uniref:Phosphotransacetylase n=1 Tax=Acrocarpospora corrugata TaxID=35763 RepID=A0A5M3W1W1_9ACTN|nr:hypothetical protein Acor_51530 [Acrocarpospora corrugata]
MLPYTSHRPSDAALTQVRQSATVPLWIPWPLPTGWLVTGFGAAGDERTDIRGSVVAVSGPSITDGPADLLLIAEEPGIGLGAAYAGLAGPDPGDFVGAGPPHVKVSVNGHPTPLWHVPDVPGDRAVYAGEALGRWLWTIAWPADAGLLLVPAQLTLIDFREVEWDVPFGAFSPRLAAE